MGMIGAAFRALLARREINIWAIVEPIPVLDTDQVRILKSCVNKVYYNDSAWADVRPEIVDRLVAGAAISLYEIIRLQMACSWTGQQGLGGGFSKPEDEAVFARLSKQLDATRNKMEGEKRLQLARERLSDEQDVVGFQRRMTWLSTIAAFCSAFSAAAAAIVTYLAYIK